MADAKFTAELVDKVSRPADKAAKSLGRLSKSAKRSQRAMKAPRDGLGRFSSSARKSSRSAGMMKGAMGGLAGALAVVGTAAVAAAYKLAQVAVDSGLKFVSLAADIETNAMALKILQKGMKGPAIGIADLTKLAQGLNMPVLETVDSFKKLIASGLSKKLSGDIIKLTADLKAVGLVSADESSRIIDTMRKIKTSGVLQAEELNRLSDAGIGAGKVYEEIGKIMGKTAKEAKKLAQTGKVNSDIALEAIKNTVNATLGQKKLGDTAKSSKKTLSGMWADFKNDAETALIGLVLQALPEIKKAAVELKGLFKGVFKSGDFKSILGAALTGIKAIVRLVPVLIEYWKGIASGFKAAFKPFMPTLKKLGGTLKGLMKQFGGMGKVGKIFGAIIGTVFGALAVVIGGVAVAVMEVANWIKTAIGYVYSLGDMGLEGALSSIATVAKDALVSAGTAIFDWFKNMPIRLGMVAIEMGAAAISIGSSIISGIVSGILSNMGAVGNAVIAAAKGAIGSGLSVLGIDSPSKVFEGIGMHTMEGFGQGIDRGGAKIPSKVAGQLNPSALTSRMGSQNVSMRNNVGGITINAADDPEATAAAVKGVLLTEMGDAFEQMSLQLGVS